MHQNRQVSYQLADIQDQISLMLDWRSVSESGGECFAVSCGYQGMLYVVYESLRPIAMQSNDEAKPNIFDALLTLILPRAYPQCGTLHICIIYE